MAQDWQMSRPGEACLACRREFPTGEAFQAGLYESPAGYERRDYCLNCGVPAEPSPLAVWKTRRPAPTKKAQPFDREAIYGFFQRLDGPDPESGTAEPADALAGPPGAGTEPAGLSAEKVQFRFVLALLLWRKKILKFEQTLHEGGREIWQFAAPAAERTHRVERPDLDEAQMEKLSAQLEQLLVGGGDQADPLATEVKGGVRA